MSLTSQLKDPTSQVRQFFNEQLPNIGEPLRHARTKLSGAETIRPIDSKTPYSTLGIAIDYRFRYYFAVASAKKLVASEGANRLELFGNAPHLSMAYHRQFIPSLNRVLAKAKPAGRRLSREEEDGLLRHCVVLAWFEEFYRSGEARDRSPLIRMDCKSVSDMLAVVRDDWVDDLRALSWKFHENFCENSSQPAMLNPTFEGSTDVGGADADLILDDCLVDFKTTTDTKLKADKFAVWLYQLLGYVLLDYGDKHGITRVGIYFVRQGVKVEWMLPALLATLAGGQGQSLPDLRSRFRRTVSNRYQGHSKR